MILKKNNNKFVINMKNKVTTIHTENPYIKKSSIRKFKKIKIK